MSISSISGQSSAQNLLLADLKKSGLSSDMAEQVDSEIKSVFDSLSSSGTKASPTDVRAAIEDKLKEDVEAGTLTQDQADQVLSALDEFESQLQQSGGPQGASGSGGGQAPDPTELFKKLDSDGDGKVTKDEFVSSRPEDVSEEDAAAFYDKIAEESGGDADSGLSEDEFTTGMQKAGPPPGPPPGGGAPPAASSDEDDDEDDTTTSTTTTTSSSAQSLQEILKALTEGDSDSSDTATYLSKLLSGKLVDTVA